MVEVATADVDMLAVDEAVTPVTVTALAAALVDVTAREVETVAATAFVVDEKDAALDVEAATAEVLRCVRTRTEERRCVCVWRRRRKAYDCADTPVSVEA